MTSTKAKIAVMRTIKDTEGKKHYLDKPFLNGKS